MTVEPEAVRAMAAAYTAAWNSGSPGAVASFYAPDGHIVINRGEPWVGRKGIGEMAAGFFADVPDLKLVCDEVVALANPDVPLKPASNQKLFTSAAALALLKPDFVFHTIFYAAEPMRGGVVNGDLYIQGRGAPDLVGEFWWLMVQELYRQGLREIRGDLVGDDTYFDSEERPTVWPRTVPDDSWVTAPVEALSFNYDVVTIRIRPGPAVGDRPSVELIPMGDFFKVNNRATTTRARSRLYVGRGYQQGTNTVTVSES